MLISIVELLKIKKWLDFDNNVETNALTMKAKVSKFCLSGIVSENVQVD